MRAPSKWIFLAGFFIAIGVMMVPEFSSRNEVLAAPDKPRSTALFMQLAPVLQHPRCMNCHTSTDFPRQGDDSHPHIMQVKRGPADSGVAALQCSTCHQTTNSPAGIPGADNWHLAPLRMAWEGLTTAEICRSLVDPVRGGFTPEQLVPHLTSDHLVLWAWSASLDLNGNSRQPPPIPHEQFAALVKQWVATGAACPAD